ncbi:hypothetical protein ACF8Q9_22070 [Pseudomonas sp. TYF_15]|uniref:hypothetical protein n=2 Tax=Pseudomonas TaxID=286 RepID=UPI0023DEA119|nr:hypothetical protein [Pseudomonas sp. ER28]MDF3173544.1 hypothetical protein [Pseudomonas sp. ER28]
MKLKLNHYRRSSMPNGYILKSALLALSFLLSPAAFSAPTESTESMENHITSKIGSSSEEWNKTVATLTNEPLWNSRDAYDASHTLMVPMHFAFAAGDTKGVEQFEHLMSQFTQQELPSGQLNQAQWLYLVTRYLALRAEFNYNFSKNDLYLVQRIAAWLHNRWMFEPAYQWGQLPLTGAKQRMNLISSTSKSWPLSYYPAVTDYELFLFAAASDIKYITEKLPETIKLQPKEINTSIEELASTGISVVRERGTFTSDGGWLFQVGTWTDHPDFRFAGHTKIEENLSEKRLKDISEDSSHSHRWPLFFRSMIAASNNRPQDKDLLLKSYHGFSKQFVNNVVVIRSKSVLLNNYMNGNNGLYRYKYATIGKNDKLGYGPNALSGILGESWYPFSSGVTSIYETYEKSYPLSKSTIELYVGPNTTRDRNPLFVWPQFFTDGFAELIAKQGAYLAKHYSLDK